MDDPAVALEVLTAINDARRGHRVDDFGTGYSSLTYLRNLPIREIKIDRSFVSGMHRRSADDLTIVRSTIDLGHNLGLEVVAEGVEDPLTLLRLGDPRLRPGPGLPHQPAAARSTASSSGSTPRRAPTMRAPGADDGPDGDAGRRM